jgi:hypothetical protein
MSPVDSRTGRFHRFGAEVGLEFHVLGEYFGGILEREDMPRQALGPGSSNPVSRDTIQSLSRG